MLGKEEPDNVRSDSEITEAASNRSSRMFGAVANHATALAMAIKYRDVCKGQQKGLNRLNRRIARLEYELMHSERMREQEPMAQRSLDLDYLQEMQQHLQNNDTQMVASMLADWIDDLERITLAIKPMPVDDGNAPHD